MAGLDSTGFSPKRLADILADIDAELLASVSPDLDLDDPESVIGQIRGVFAAELALVWEAIADVYRALDINSAVGEQLDTIGRFLQLPRLEGARGTGTVTLSGTAGTIVPEGTRLRNSSTGVIVETSNDATIGGGGTVTGVPVRSILAEHVVSGVNGIDTIVTPVAGLSSVTASSALVGSRTRETDADYRLRLINTTEIVGSVEGAIRAAILQVESVTKSIVLSNRTNTTNALGTPPGDIRIVIEPDLTGQTEVEADIAEAIFSTQPAGHLTFATGANARTATVQDQQGYDQEVSWEYPTQVDIYVDVSAVVDFEQTTLSIAEAESVISDAITEYINALGLGEDVRTAGIRGAIDDAVPGAVWDVGTLTLDTTPSPTATTSIALAFNQVAAAQTINVTVTAL